MLAKLDEKLSNQCKKECNKLCDRLYNNSKQDVSNYRKLLQKVATMDYDDMSQRIFKGIYDLRNEIAKKYDENAEYILSKHAMFQICINKPQSIKQLKEIMNKYEYPYTQIINQQLIDVIKNPPEVQITQEVSQRSKHKEQRKQQYYQNWTCKAPVYENCRMLAPDGQVLCHCDKKKVDWYLSRNLGKLVSDNPMTIQLTFEPTGRTYIDANDASDSYYCQEKKNACVVCGAGQNYLRYHVVPILYRQHFPNNFKSHRSHDIVLLCGVCHEIGNKANTKLQKQIAEEYGVPINIQNELNQQKNELWSIKKLCLSLNKHRLQISKSKEVEWLQKIQDSISKYQSFQELFPNFAENQETYIQQLCNPSEFDQIMQKLNLSSKRRDQNLHGKLVVEKIQDLGEFIKRWRQHFLDSLQPKYLPAYWSVDHEISRKFGKFSQFAGEEQGNEQEK